ncbi:MAG TPA: amidophosphoribosyltransferase [Bacteroidales bacterium]|nr:amidophosphoribosyltransferase [Bacteroidales bacterium]HOS72930.1 amidophosphoribosyltransferase [Bacteroidales bacterium]HQH23189.1 amidophosphoribosyltransferase [Bacteroidales bacterium]HQJ80953.1 amidophosphoribosyltransferase [Bacteroidales bacterium]
MSGFFGVVSNQDCVREVFYGTDYHSHLGTRRAGMVFIVPGKGFRRSIHTLENSYFRTKFEDELKDFRGNVGMGIISDTDPQPILFTSHLGRFAIVTVSRLVNIAELEAKILGRKKHFTENFEGTINPTEVIASLICEKDSFIEGIEYVFENVRGSCSLMIMTEDGIIAARDKYGRTPVVIGRKDGACAIASESCSFPNTGFELEYFMGPGEIVRVSSEGYTQLRKPGNTLQICAFLWVYYGYPPSYYEGINVDECRYRCGAALARRDSVEADFVCGIPDSGVGHAIGYGNEKKIPNKRAYSKYTDTWPRSFLPSFQGQRNLVARMKLIPNRAVISGKKMIFIDDSIVRGTQLRHNTNDMRKYGAKELHMRIACPPILYPCDFLNFIESRTPMELAARRAVRELGGRDEELREYSDPDSEKYRKMVEKIAEKLDLDSLLYQRLDDLIAAIGLPREKLCTHCWDGTGYF